MDDRQLVTRALRDSEAAWVQIVQRYQEPVFRLAYLMLGNAEDAEDVAQETFARAFRFLARFDVNQPLRPWLLRIARNVALNRRRSIKRYWRAVQQLGRGPERPAAMTTTLEYDKQAEAERLWQAIQQLRRQDQEVIYLRYFLELSTAESAATLSIAPGTVKSRLHRALERLRVTIAKLEPELYEEWWHDAAD